MTNKTTSQILSQSWAVVACIEAADSVGIDASAVGPIEAQIIARTLETREGIAASGRKISAAKVADLLKGAF